MAQGPSDTILVAIRITLRIWESKVRNLDHPDRRRFVLCECILVSTYFAHAVTVKSDKLPTSNVTVKCTVLLCVSVRTTRYQCNTANTEC